MSKYRNKESKLCYECEYNNESKLRENLGDILYCTTDENGEHHSYNDEPSWVEEGFAGTRYVWHKNGDLHRYKKPAMFYDCGNDKIYKFYYNGIKEIETKNKLNNNIIIFDDQCFDKISNKLHLKWDKIAVILYQMTEYDPNVYLCLVDNEKRYIKLI